MRLSTAILVSATIAALATFTEAHSWVECTDWRFKDPNQKGWRDQDGECHGYARKFEPKHAFGTQDREGSRSRHYEQGTSTIPCSPKKGETGQDELRQSPVSNSYGGNFGNMATVKAGDTMCVRWPAKNHAVKNEQDRGVFINMPQTLLSQDPDQGGFTAANLVQLKYKNCTSINDSDKDPCGGCFQIPSTLQTGTYVMQWRWELNDDEWYTSCWDVGVTAPGSNNTDNSTKTLDETTSVFAELAEL